MTGKHVFTDPVLTEVNGHFIKLYDLIEAAAIKRMEMIQKDEELSEEDFDLLTRVQDFQLRAQESLENTALLTAKLAVL